MNTIPKTDAEALEWLRPLLDRSALRLRRIPEEAFLKAWHAIAFLYPGLHPDEAKDHGGKIMATRAHNEAQLERNPVELAAWLLDTRLVAPYFIQSGWPVILEPIAAEAWRRYEEGQLTEEQFYPTEAQAAGITSRTERGK